MSCNHITINKSAKLSVIISEIYWSSCWGQSKLDRSHFSIGTEITTKWSGIRTDWKCGLILKFGIGNYGCNSHALPYKGQNRPQPWDANEKPYNINTYSPTSTAHDVTIYLVRIVARELGCIISRLHSLNYQEYYFFFYQNWLPEKKWNRGTILMADRCTLRKKMILYSRLRAVNLSLRILNNLIPHFSFSQSSFVSFHNGHIAPEQQGPAGSRPKNLQALCDYVQQWVWGWHGWCRCGKGTIIFQVQVKITILV